MALAKWQNITQPSGVLFPFLSQDNLIGFLCVKNASNITIFSGAPCKGYKDVYFVGIRNIEYPNLPKHVSLSLKKK